MIDILDFLKRHGTLILLMLVITLLGGFRAEQFATFKAAMLAECVALFLSSVALFIFTSDRFLDREARNAKTIVFLAVHLLVGLVYAGSYFVEFAPGGGAF
jgi:hypothetical protein